MRIFGTNVLKSRDIDRVIVLGSGMSILDLTKEEKKHIARCKYVIAFNKFMAFYKKAGVLPTHVYFYDKHDNSFDFFKYILKVCRKDSLCNLTFITNELYAQNRKSFKSFFKFYRLRIEKKVLHKKLSIEEKEWIRNFKNNSLLYPINSKILAINVGTMIEGGDWAANLKQKIFHYRGSLTSVLNICTILFPNTDVFLVGNDFNYSSYFFEEEINELKFAWKDWTYDLVKKEGKHFSYQNYQGTSMEDNFLFIIESMSKTNNNLYCINPNSLLIESGVKYKPLL